MANDIIIYKNNGITYAELNVLSWRYCGSGYTTLTAIKSLVSQLYKSNDLIELFRFHKIRFV